MKKRILLVLTISWAIFIFYMSSLNGDESTNLSNGLLYRIAMLFRIVDMKDFINECSNLIRSLAHFVEFFIFGFLLFLTLHLYDVKKVLMYAIVICFVFAIFDEVHQIFVEDRVFDLLDVLIDSFGFLLSIFSLHFILLNVSKRKSS